MNHAAGEAGTTIDVVDVGWNDADAIRLRDAFDAEMSERYSDTALATETAAIRIATVFAVDPETFVTCVLVRVDGVAAAHGALFERASLGAIEIRKVVVDSAFRGHGLGHRIMHALESRAAERGAERVVLDTGPKQPDAIALYERRGYSRIPVFEPYTAVPNAICFEKRLTAGGAGS